MHIEAQLTYESMTLIWDEKVKKSSFAKGDKMPRHGVRRNRITDIFFSTPSLGTLPRLHSLRALRKRWLGPRDNYCKS